MNERAVLVMRAFEREDELVLALGARDPRAWRQLFEEQYQRVYSYAFVRTGNSADAEDIASGVFASAVKGIGSYSYRGTPIAAWLFRIAHHETVDLLKRRSRNAASSLDSAVAELPASGASDEWRDVARAMEGLNAEQQQVLTLRLIEGRPVAEVAQLLGKSKAAVKMAQMRALQALRRRLVD